MHIVRCKERSTCAKAQYRTYKHAKQGPVYMNSKSYLNYFKEKVDCDGVPLVAPDDTPIGNKIRPQRKEVDWWWRTTKTMRTYNTWDWLSKDPMDSIVHKSVAPKIPVVIPEPRNGMTVETFLTKIGRGCAEHISLFESWEHFYNSRGREMKKLGVPVRDRKYILRWKEFYRQGREPKYLKLQSKAGKNANLEWRQALITQKEKRIALGLDE